MPAGSPAPRPATLPPDLPLVLTTRDLVRLSGLTGRYAAQRLRRRLRERGIEARPTRGSAGLTYDLEALAAQWPEFVRAIRARMARDAGLRLFPDYSWFEEP